LSTPRGKQWLAATAERAGDALAARPWILALAYTLLFLPLSILLSSRTPLASDEIYTVYLSRLPGIRAILHALAEGADLQPPAIYIATRMSQALFGPSEWAIRLPVALGVLLMGLCLMYFVARRTNMLWGFVAALFVLLTGAFPFVIDARPYGLVLGFTGAALLCWQCASEGRRRKLALVGLFASLILAVSSHYYAILLFFPFILGEAVRNFVNRKIDQPMWFSLLIAAPSVLLFLPLLGKSMHAVITWESSQVKMSALWESYRELGSSQAMLGLFSLLIIGLICGLAGIPVKPKLAFPLAEVAAAAGFLALPFAGLAFALTVTHNLTSRYVIAMTIGAGLVFVFSAHRFTGGNSTAALMLAASLGGIFLVHLATEVHSATLDGAEPVALGNQYPDLPVVVGSGLDFAAAWYYAPPDLRSRLIFVSDPRMAMRYSHGDLTNSSIAFGARFFQWRVQSFDQFRQNNRKFLLNWTDGERWMLPAYLDLGAKVEALNAAGAGVLYLVTDDGFAVARSKHN